MPFVPLTPEEERACRPSCNDIHHLPSVMGLVITHPMKWQCPSCGAEVIFHPQTVMCDSSLDDWPRVTGAM